MGFGKDPSLLINIQNDMSDIVKNNKNVYTDLSCLQVIVKGIHRVGQAVNIVENFMVQGPIQTIRDVHLVKVFLHIVIRKEGVQGPLVSFKNCWGYFLSHGAFGKQRTLSQSCRYSPCTQPHSSSLGIICSI